MKSFEELMGDNGLGDSKEITEKERDKEMDLKELWTK